jgi:hypothetical protein
VKEAVSKLRIGMTKAELDQAVKDIEFIKEQTVSMYPNSTEDQMRDSLQPDSGERVHPNNLISQLTFDENIKVYSYLISKKKAFAAPPQIDYLAVFYSQKEDKVLGWGQFKTMMEPRVWRDTF